MINEKGSLECCWYNCHVVDSYFFFNFQGGLFYFVVLRQSLKFCVVLAVLELVM